jgi:hypothetical protein
MSRINDTIATYGRENDTEIELPEYPTQNEMMFHKMQQQLAVRTLVLNRGQSMGRIEYAAWSLGYNRVVMGEWYWIFVRDISGAFKVVHLGEHDIYELSEAELFMLLRPSVERQKDGEI